MKVAISDFASIVEQKLCVIYKLLSIGVVWKLAITAKSKTYYEKVLDLDAQNAEAKMGLRLAESIITNPNVTIERLNSFCAKDVGANIVLDGNKIRKIDNGERVKLTLPVGEHTIMFYFTGYGKNKPVKFRIDGFYTNVSITFKTKLMCKVDVSVDVNNT